MAGWTIIDDMEQRGNLTASDAKRKRDSSAPSIEDYFEEITATERKCRLCSTTVKYFAAQGFGNMRRHFKNKHLTEWKKVEPFVKTRKSRKATANNNSNAFELITSDVAPADGNCSNDTNAAPLGDVLSNNIQTKSIDMVLFDENDLIDEGVGVNESDEHDRSFAFDSIDYGNGYTPGQKRAKIARQIVFDSCASSLNVPSDGLNTADGIEQVNNKGGHAKDEFSIFGEFIASELRNMKISRRRQLKREIQKLMLVVTDGEEDEEM